MKTLLTLGFLKSTLEFFDPTPVGATIGISKDAAHKADEWTTGIHKGFNYNSRQRWLKDDNDDMEQ